MAWISRPESRGTGGQFAWNSQHLREPSFIGFDSVARGKNLEGLVYQEIKAFLSCNDIRRPIWFWRTRNGIEVDFIISPEPRSIWAIEVKLTDRIRNEDLSGLREFKKDYPESKLFFLYCGKQKEKWDDGINVMPVESFLSDELWSAAKCAK